MTTVVDRVRARAQRRPDEVAYRFLRRHDDPGSTLTWGELWTTASAVAGALPVGTTDGPCGVLISCRDEAHFVTAMLATWIREATAIPTVASTNRNLRERNAHVVSAGRPDVILHDLSPAASTALHEHAPTAALVDISSAVDADPTPPSTPAGGGADLLQLTSGSTSSPKAVHLSAEAIAANCRAIDRAFGLGPDSVGVHWLPLHHDMGLIGGVVGPMWTGTPSVLLRPSAFIQRPVSWLQAVSTWRGTITSAPNFAYERVAHAVRPADLEGIDLTCLDSVIIGAEPVHETTLQRLMETFGPVGLRRSALAPSYGLAEVTLLASTGKRADGPVFDRRHSSRPVPSLGAPVGGLSFTIVDAEGSECAAGELGRIRITGDCAGRVIETGKNWRTPSPIAPIETGDFGYLLDGEIHVTGRTSNRIIIRGKNVYAEDVEQLAAESAPPGSVTGVAAFGVERDGTEELYVLVELARRADPLDTRPLNAALGSHLGVKAGDVVALRAPALPRTTSGKIRRSLARSQFLSGEYERRHVPRSSAAR